MSGSAARLLAALLVIAPAAGAVVFDERAFDTADQRLRYHALIRELRCLVCQNQSLADSDADLADDLRNQVYTMIKAGADDERIVGYLTDRYGDFVRYRPPFEPATLALWTGPFVLAAAALAILTRRIRAQRRQEPPVALSEAERARLNEMLGVSADGNERT